MLEIKQLGLVDYQTCFQAMKQFTDNRTEQTADQIWSVEHPPVFTQGQAGKKEHIIVENDIPLVQSDRGGQVTYHGPGQIVIYPLVKLKRYKLTVRGLVCLIEKSMIATLHQYGITANQRDSAPGVYVNNAKIGSLGLRIRHGHAYHGLSLNVDMDLTPFSYINPCGYSKLAVTQLRDHKTNVSIKEVEQALIKTLTTNLTQLVDN